MKKYALILLAVLGFSYVSNAQPPKYDDLTILFADANYVKLVDECLKYNDRKSTSRDALPYLYLAKAYYSISQQGDRPAEYKNAFKYAASAMRKFLRYDKQHEYADESDEFLEKYKAAAAEDILNNLDAKDYRKLHSSISTYKKVSADNLGVQYLDAAGKYLSGDRSSYTQMLRDLSPEFKALKDLNGASPTDIKLYKKGFITVAQVMIKTKQVDKAKEFLDKAQSLIQEEDFKKECAALF